MRFELTQFALEVRHPSIRESGTQNFFLFSVTISTKKDAFTYLFPVPLPAPCAGRTIRGPRMVLALWVRVMELKSPYALRIPASDTFAAHQRNRSSLCRPLALPRVIVDALLAPVHMLVLATFENHIKVV